MLRVDCCRISWMLTLSKRQSLNLPQTYHYRLCNMSLSSSNMPTFLKLLFEGILLFPGTFLNYQFPIFNLLNINNLSNSYCNFRSWISFYYYSYSFNHGYCFQLLQHCVFVEQTKQNWIDERFQEFIDFTVCLRRSALSKWNSYIRHARIVNMVFSECIPKNTLGQVKTSNLTILVNMWG